MANWRGCEIAREQGRHEADRRYSECDPAKRWYGRTFGGMMIYHKHAVALPRVDAAVSTTLSRAIYVAPVACWREEIFDAIDIEVVDHNGVTRVNFLRSVSPTAGRVAARASVAEQPRATIKNKRDQPRQSHRPQQREHRK